MDGAGMIQAAALEEARRERMRTPDEVAAMLALKARGWGVKRIAREFGTCPKTVRRYVREGGWAGYSRVRRVPVLEDLSGWLEERLVRHGGNADVVRQELATEHGLVVSLRTVERACAPFRQQLQAAVRATVRFETLPGRQLQIDFGERRVTIAGAPVRVHLFVATLGHSRRLHVRAFRGKAQENWFEGIEGAFQAFGGVPEEILFDNARALVDRHDAGTREVVFNVRLHAFARHWRVRPRACAPYRARTKGKDERGVGYVKRNAIAGRDFPSSGQRSRRIWSPGRARWPTCGCTARRARRRWRGSSAMRPGRCARWTARRRSGRRATWSVGCTRTARSRWRATAIRCPGA